MDSNHRPPAYQADALTCWAISPFFSPDAVFLKIYISLPRGCRRSSCPVSLGGDNRDRTDDPLLAKQVLSQLSYTPVAIPFVKVQSVAPYEPQKLNNEKT